MKSPVRKTKKNKKRKKDPALAAVDFFAEAGLLKSIKRSGWWVAGIKDPESVAEHSFRCAVIAYYLAYEENADVHKVVTMALFNDIHEARINDLHKMGHYYIDFKNAEKKVFKDQVEFLDKRIKSQLVRLRDEYDRQSSRESIIARDADILECLIQAKEYFDGGYLGAKKFFQKAPEYLRSRSARKFWRRIKNWHSSNWWQDIVKFER